MKPLSCLYTLALCFLFTGLGSVRAYDAGMPNPPNSPTVVEVGFFIADIVNLDELNETFEAEVIIYASWHDPRMAFDAEEAGVDYKLYQGAFQFNEVYPGWWPQLLIVNEVGSGDINAIKIQSYADGTQNYLEQRNVTLETPMSLQRFPFDVQELEAQLIAFGDYNDEVVLQVDKRLEGASEAYAQNNNKVNIAQWSLLELDMEVADVEIGASGLGRKFSSLKVDILMQRKPTNIIWKVIFPLIILVLLMWSIFWMDIDALSDRLNIAFIGILTIVAYQFLVDGNMPRISYFTFTDSVLLYSFLVMCLTVLESLILYSMCQNNHRARAEKLDLIAQWAFPFIYFGGIAASYFYYVS